MFKNIGCLLIFLAYRARHAGRNAGPATAESAEQLTQVDHQYRLLLPHGTHHTRPGIQPDRGYQEGKLK